MVQVAYVNVFVRDFAAARAFYGDTLRLPLKFADEEHGYASFDAGPISLGVAVAGEDHDELVGGLTGIGLAVDDLVAEHARLEQEGVRFEMPPTRQSWGGFMALVCDPDGNTLYLDEVAAAHGD